MGSKTTEINKNNQIFTPSIVTYKNPIHLSRLNNNSN